MITMSPIPITWSTMCDITPQMGMEIYKSVLPMSVQSNFGHHWPLVCQSEHRLNITTRSNCNQQRCNYSVKANLDWSLWFIHQWWLLAKSDTWRVSTCPDINDSDISIPYTCTRKCSDTWRISFQIAICHLAIQPLRVKACQSLYY